MTDSADYLDRYLRHNRILRRGAPGSSGHSEHARFLADALLRLQPEGPSRPPRLHLTWTANCIVETLALPAERVLLYDHGYGRAMRRMNEFVFGPLSLDQVISWGLEKLSAALIARGDIKRSLAALYGSVFLRPGTPDVLDDPDLHTAAISALIQDYFAIAHECVHLALEDGRLTVLARAHKADVEWVTNWFRESSASIDRAVLDDASRAAIKSTLPGFCTPDGTSNTQPDWLVRVMSDLAVRLGVPAEGDHLEEELLCDAVATEMTLGAFRAPFGDEVTIMAIYVGFRNLQELEYIRSLSQQLTRPVGKPFTVGRDDLGEALVAQHGAQFTFADDAEDPELTERLAHLSAEQGIIVRTLIADGARSTGRAATHRLSVWRGWLPNSSCEMPSDRVHAGLVRLSDRYSTAVGDPIAFALHERFTAGYEAMGSKGGLVVGPESMLILIRRECDGDVLARIVHEAKRMGVARL